MINFTGKSEFAGSIWNYHFKKMAIVKMSRNNLSEELRPTSFFIVRCYEAQNFLINESVFKKCCSPKKLSYIMTNYFH